MDTYEALTTRTSSRTLTEPGLDDAAIAKLIEMGARAPDHGRLRPWQFLLVRGAARQQLGEVFAEALRRANVEASPEMLRREREKPLRAPVILIVAVTPKEHAAVPEIEQVISGGAAAQNILLCGYLLAGLAGLGLFLAALALIVVSLAQAPLQQFGRRRRKCRSKLSSGKRSPRPCRRYDRTLCPMPGEDQGRISCRTAGQECHHHVCRPCSS